MIPEGVTTRSIDLGIVLCKYAVPWAVGPQYQGPYGPDALGVVWAMKQPDTWYMAREVYTRTGNLRVCVPFIVVVVSVLFIIIIVSYVWFGIWVLYVIANLAVFIISVR